MEKYIPLIMSMLGGFVRVALGGVIGWMIANGVIQEGQAAEVIGAVVTGVVAIGWIVYNKIKEKRVLNTAVASPTMTTVEAVQEKVSKGEFAPATTPTDQVPVIQGTGSGGA